MKRLNRLNWKLSVFSENIHQNYVLFIKDPIKRVNKEIGNHGLEENIL